MSAAGRDTARSHVITSIHNRRVAEAARLKKRAMREKDRLFLVEGVQGVLEALRSPGVVREIFYANDSESRLDAALRAAEEAGVAAHPVSQEVMAHLTSTVTPQGLVAVAAFTDVSLRAIPKADRCAVVLVEVRDPGNAGTILRSADAAGADAVVFTRSSVDVYNAKAVRASAGSIFHVPVVRGVDVAEAVTDLRASGRRVFGASADGRTSVYVANLADPIAVLFGNEAHGLPDEVRAMADDSLRVPLHGTAESLNLAAAATIVLFEAARQRSVRLSGSPGESRSPR